MQRNDRIDLSGRRRHADGIEDECHDGEYRDHDKHSDDAPKHMLSAGSSRILAIAISHIPEDSPEEVNERDKKDEADERIDDDRIHLMDEIDCCAIGLHMLGSNCG